MSAAGMERPLLPDDVDRLVQPIGGWLGPLEGRLLYRLAAAADPSGCIVEIGSWQGRSTIWLAAGASSGRGARVVAVDPHRGTSLRAEGESTEPMLRANLERSGLVGSVDVLVATSHEAVTGWSRPVSLLWIDGDHSYESALQDVDMWEPHLLPNATIALHDTFVLPGPERVVRERLIGSRRYTNFEHAETTTAAQRCGDLSVQASLERRLSVMRRSLYGVRLRAYDSNRLGYTRLRTALARSRA
ncbi:MAG: class I SAM-dependent methyltransferase [Actinomycetota bacterium]